MNSILLEQPLIATNSTDQLAQLASSSESLDDPWHNTSLNFLIHDIWETGGDPRVSQFALMRGGPWPVLAIIFSYLLFVKKIGPQFMATRQPFDLKYLIFSYNMVMMILNAYFFYSAAKYTNYGLKAWSCIKINPSDFDSTMQLKLTIIWYFFISKFVDLLETVFFVLRKKHNQASFLHIFHHSIVPIDVWVGFKYSPSESACFFPFINSFVHTIMYFYYALSVLGPRVKPFLWWKKYLTQIQIFQLILVAIHCVHLVMLPNCNIPKAIFAIYLPQVIFLVYLFASFFVSNYILSSSKKSN